MAVYLITYDLIDPGQDYDELYDEIKDLADDYIHPCESNWFVKTELDPGEIVDKLYALDGTDKVIVMKVITPWATEGLDKDDLDWLHENV